MKMAPPLQFTLPGTLDLERLCLQAPGIMDAYTVNPCLRALFLEQLQVRDIPEERILDYLVFRPNQRLRVQQVFILFAHPEKEGMICLLSLHHKPQFKDEAWKGNLYLHFNGHREEMLYALPKEEPCKVSTFVPTHIHGVEKVRAPNSTHEYYSLTLADNLGNTRKIDFTWPDGKLHRGTRRDSVIALPTERLETRAL